MNNYSKYRFHNISLEQQIELFDKSVALLYDIILPIKKDCKINAYRAGGWSLQPFGDFKSLFEKHSIQYEFSVLPGFKNLSNAQYFDFSMIKENSNAYNFSEEVNAHDANGKFKEFPISTITLSNKQALLNKLWLKYLWKIGNRSCGDGLSVSSKEGVIERVNSKAEMVSIELLNSIKLPAYKSFIERHTYMHFISHPKMLSNHNLKCFEDLLQHLSKNYEVDYDFVGML